MIRFTSLLFACCVLIFNPGHSHEVSQRHCADYQWMQIESDSSALQKLEHCIGLHNKDVNATDNAPRYIRKLYPESKSWHRRTALHWIALIGDTPSVAYLIKQGADVNIRDRYGNTPLHYAASDGYEESVKLLIAAGADVNSQGMKKNSPLHYAALEGYEGICRALVKAGADVKAKRSGGVTPISLARRHNNEICYRTMTSSSSKN